jgi:CheY-like chemotaxis protein/nitrogen-specific signal transduction histidine kinase
MHGALAGESKLDERTTPIVPVGRSHLGFAERESPSLQDELGEARRIGRLKDEFLITLSHELRTPLSAILGWATILQRNPVDPSTLQQAVSVIERNARLQVQLIDDLLDMSAIMAGKIRLEVGLVSPETFIEAALATVRPAADARQIRLEKVLDPSAGPVSGDASRLQQVMWNLLSNAIKFTPKGGTITVVLERSSSHVEIGVTDTGRGISAEFLPFVFERFSQAETSRKTGGLGIGLSIVKNLTELHGGTVSAKSKGVDQGSTFLVSLPYTAVYRQRAESGHQPTTGVKDLSDFELPVLDGVKVLALDDEPDGQDLIVRILEQCGAVVRTFQSGEAALQGLKGFSPDVIISDIDMPSMDGLEFLRRARSDGSDAPAIALSALGRAQDRMEALRAGYVAYLVKPAELVELAANVAAVLRRPVP